MAMCVLCNAKKEDGCNNGRKVRTMGFRLHYTYRNENAGIKCEEWSKWEIYLAHMFFCSFPPATHNCCVLWERISV